MLHIGDAREWAASLAPGSVQTIVTSPPYWGLRSYLPNDDPVKHLELGQEKTPAEYVANLVAVFRALWPALADDGTLWLNLGDSYARKGGTDRTVSPTAKVGSTRNTLVQMGDRCQEVPEGFKEKSLIGIPWRVAFALQDDGWTLRSDIIWHKPAPMPESVTDRPTRSHEYLFLLSKQSRYYYDAAAIAEPCVAGDRGSTYTDGKTGAVHSTRGQGQRTDKQAASGLWTYEGFNARWDAAPTETRNKRDVWTIATAGYPEAHFATFPADLVRPCLRAGSRPGDVVGDPFAGSGTVAQVATEEGRQWVGCDLDERAREWTRARLDGRQIRLGLGAA